jgi:hypothetical protein
LWVVTNILGNVSVRAASTEPRLTAFIDLVDGFVSIPLSLLLMAIMRRIVEGQDLAVRQEIFA